MTWGQTDADADGAAPSDVDLSFHAGSGFMSLRPSKVGSISDYKLDVSSV